MMELILYILAGIGGVALLAAVALLGWLFWGPDCPHEPFYTMHRCKRCGHEEYHPTDY